MKKVVLITFLFLYCLQGKSQFYTYKNYNYLSFYSKFLKLIDTPQLNQNDIEIRLLFNNGMNKINTAYYISMVRLNRKWKATYYAFTTFYNHYKNDSVIIHKYEPIKLKYDSLYNNLLQDSLLTLNSDSIGIVVNKKLPPGIMWADGGPINYSIQIITYKKRWVLNYRCPKYFYYEAKIEEFKLPYKIISSLLAIAGMDPC